MRLAKIKKSKDFQHIGAVGTRFVARAFVLLGAEVTISEAGDASVCYGITASRKLGGAVKRNRIKRRLRAAIEATLPAVGKAGWSYVFIGRQACADVPFEKLLAEVDDAVQKLPNAKKGK